MAYIETPHLCNPIIEQIAIQNKPISSLVMIQMNIESKSKNKKQKKKETSQKHFDAKKNTFSTEKQQQQKNAHKKIHIIDIYYIYIYNILLIKII